MKRIICILLVCVCLASLLACSKYDESYVYDGKSLIGKWCEKERDESYRSYEFFENGTVELCEYYYGIKTNSVLAAYTAEKSEIVTTVTNYDGTKEYIHQKFSVNGDELVFVYLNEENQMTEEEMVLVPFKDDFSDTDSELIGSWKDTENENEVWSFENDFTGTISDENNTYKMYYSIDGKKLYMAYEFIDGVIQSIAEFEYKIKKDTLTISGTFGDDSVKLVLERK